LLGAYFAYNNVCVRYSFICANIGIVPANCYYSKTNIIDIITLKLAKYKGTI